jgi:hypothetical protein
VDLAGLLLPPGHDLLVQTIRPGHTLLLLILVRLDERTVSRETWDTGEREYRMAAVGHVAGSSLGCRLACSLEHAARPQHLHGLRGWPELG